MIPLPVFYSFILVSSFMFLTILVLLEMRQLPLVVVVVWFLAHQGVDSHSCEEDVLFSTSVCHSAWVITQTWKFCHWGDNGTKCLLVQHTVKSSVILTLSHIASLDFWGSSPRDINELLHTSWIGSCPVERLRRWALQQPPGGSLLNVTARCQHKEEY